ncbi:MAG: DUF433 domain-containing protein [Pyrinomonadaceae bacterium]|nr:DUF433 domain-containing protein [Pyrinomonadaceae bacterium]
MLTTDTKRALNIPGLIWTDPERMSGAPCFDGTRVPIKNLFDYLAGDETIDEFLEGFPGVTREQAEAVIDLARKKLLEEVSPR